VTLSIKHSIGSSGWRERSESPASDQRAECGVTDFGLSRRPWIDRDVILPAVKRAGWDEMLPEKPHMTGSLLRDWRASALGD
jgi:hypothetical protein